MVVYPAWLKVEGKGQLNVMSLNLNSELIRNMKVFKRFVNLRTLKRSRLGDNTLYSSQSSIIPANQQMSQKPFSGIKWYPYYSTISQNTLSDTTHVISMKRLSPKSYLFGVEKNQIGGVDFPIQRQTRQGDTPWHQAGVVNTSRIIRTTI